MQRSNTNATLVNLAVNQGLRINTEAPQGVDTLLTKVTRDNPSKPNQTRRNSQKSRGYVVLSGVMLCHLGLSRDPRNSKSPAYSERVGASPARGTTNVE